MSTVAFQVVLLGEFFEPFSVAGAVTPSTTTVVGGGVLPPPPLLPEPVLYVNPEPLTS
jgi:hypothetical protein